MIHSTTWDRAAIGLAVLYGIATIACLASIGITIPGFPLPPWIGAIGFGPACLVWLVATRRRVLIDEGGITGLTGASTLAWDEIRSAQQKDCLLVVHSKNRSTGLRAGLGQFFRWRPGVPSGALWAPIDPRVAAAVNEALQRNGFNKLD